MGRVGKLSTRSTRFTCIFWEKITEIENEIMRMYTGNEHKPLASKFWRCVFAYSSILAWSEYSHLPSAVHCDLFSDLFIEV